MAVYNILILFQKQVLAIKQDWGNPAPLSTWNSTGNSIYHSKSSTRLITIFLVLAGVVFIGAVAISWLLILRHQKRRQVLTGWKMTIKYISKCDVLGNLHEEYMENSSLDWWLHRCNGAPAQLQWPTRLGIAIDGARGLISYTHHDVKSSNILLDPSFRAKIANFGIARILVKSGEPESTSAISDTCALYMAPESMFSAKVDEKVDVYAFGVVLLELTTGRVANDGGADWCLAEWAWRRYKAGGELHDVVDEAIQDRAAFLEDAVAVFLLGVICTGDDPASRPTMKEVLEQLVQYDSMVVKRLRRMATSNDPLFCGWTRVACICGSLMLALYLVSLTHLPNLRSLLHDMNYWATTPTSSLVETKLPLVSTSPLDPSSVAVELFKLRKLMTMTLQPPPSSGTNTGDKVSTVVGHHISSLFPAACGFVGICVLGWLVVTWGRKNHVIALDFNDVITEQHIVHNLVPSNMISCNAVGEPLYRVVIEDSIRHYRSVIVKKLVNEIGGLDADVVNRCRSEEHVLGIIRHDNIVVLLGCIWRRHDMRLHIYESMDNGCLREWLGDIRQRQALCWQARRSIAIDVARGICYLHHECNNPIIHRNVQPANILLDRDLKAKIAGFDLALINFAGLGKPLANAQLPTGAFGYTAPEYTTMPEEVNEKVDVYSVGVVLLELITGRPANGSGANGHLATWAHRGYEGEFSNVIDNNIPDRARYMEEMKDVFELAVECTTTDPKERPCMKRVLHRLSKGRTFWERYVCLKR